MIPTAELVLLVAMTTEDGTVMSPFAVNVIELDPDRAGAVLELATACPCKVEPLVAKVRF